MAAGEKHEPVFEGFTHLAKEKEILPKPPKEINTYLKETFWTMVFNFTELKNEKKCSLS